MDARAAATEEQAAATEDGVGEVNALNVNRRLVWQDEELWEPGEVELRLMEVAAAPTDRQSAKQAPVAPSPWDHIDQLVLWCGGCWGETWDHQCWSTEVWVAQ